MQDLNYWNRLFQELSVGTYAYQMRAEKMIEAWLKAFWEPAENHQNFPNKLRIKNNKEAKITVRVKENPPSLQLIQYPLGGVSKAAQRVSEKLFTSPDAQILTVEEKDLTRETIIVTLEDSTADEILEHGLLSPKQLTALLESARQISPKLFIAINRSLLGIEKCDNQKVPFHLIEQKDEKTWQYLESLLSLSN